MMIIFYKFRKKFVKLKSKLMLKNTPNVKILKKFINLQSKLMMKNTTNLEIFTSQHFNNNLIEN